MLLMKSLKFFKFLMIITESFTFICSEDKIMNSNVIEIPVRNDSGTYPDYRILFSIDIIKNNSAYNSTYNNSDFLIVDDSGSSHVGKININVLDTKEQNRAGGP